jgi:hypothetical protein
MQHRYRMYWFADPGTPLGPGRPLFGSSPEEAIERAADLWEEEGPPVFLFGHRALGCNVVDTEDGTVVWRRQRERGSDSL